MVHHNHEPNFTQSLCKDEDAKNFRRHQFLDIHQARTKELMTDVLRVYAKEKRESIFPLLKSTELKQ